MGVQVYHLKYDEERLRLVRPSFYVLYERAYHQITRDPGKDTVLVHEVWNSKEEEMKYEHVADISTESLDLAYQMTNHIEHNWEENGCVVVKNGGRNRSSSIGDIFVKNGKMFIVERFGWTELTPE